MRPAAGSSAHGLPSAGASAELAPAPAWARVLLLPPLLRCLAPLWRSGEQGLLVPAAPVPAAAVLAAGAAPVSAAVAGEGAGGQWEVGAPAMLFAACCWGLVTVLPTAAVVLLLQLFPPRSWRW